MKIMGFVPAILLLAVPAAFADFTPVGVPTHGGSWYQDWIASSSFDFDLFAIRIVSDGFSFAQNTTEDPLDHFGNLALSGWSYRGQGRDDEGKHVALATGDPRNSQDFRSNFEGPTPSQPFHIDFVAYDSHNNVDKRHAGYYEDQDNKWRWHVSEGSWDGGGREHLCDFVVSAPAAPLLGMIGLGLVGWVVRRLR